MSFAVDFYARLSVLRDRDRFRFPAGDVPSHFRRAAVLLPFWEAESEIWVVLTRRSGALRSHAGQTAFPGRPTRCRGIVDPSGPA